MNLSLKQVGEKYRLKINETGGYLRQMGPRKLSKDRAEYRLAVLMGEEPYDYTNDPTSEETTAAVEAAIETYVASQQKTINSQSAIIATEEGKIETEQANIQAANDTYTATVADLDAQLEAGTITQEEYDEAVADAAGVRDAAVAASESKIATSEGKIRTAEGKIATAKDNIAHAADKASAAVINEVPEVLTLDNSSKKGYKIEADFTANEVTTVEANEEVEGGITIKNTGAEPANLIIDVGNSNVTLSTNSEWNEVTVKSVANNTLTVATYTHINKLILKRGRVWVNNAFVEDCIDEVVVEGGKVEANPAVDLSKASDFYNKPAVVNINSNFSTTNVVTGILTSGHYVYENNARIDFTRTGSTSAGFLLRGSKLLAEFKGAGEWHSANNPCIWLSDFDGVVKIYDGKYFNDANYSECIYAEKGFIEIYGGEFHNVPVEGEKNFLINCKDEQYTAGKAGITVYGGKFYGFDPAHNDTNPGGETNYVAEGYESVYHEEGDYYEVVPVDAGE